MISIRYTIPTFSRRFCIAAAAVLSLTGGAVAQTGPVTVERAIELHLQGVDSGLIVNAATRRVAGLTAFYAARGFRPVWLQDGVPTAAATVLHDTLAGAARDGLDPDAYDSGEFSPRDPYSTARYEIAQSATALRYVNDLRHGRATPSETDPDLFVEPQSFDAATTLTKLAASDNIARALDGFVPPHPQYRSLRDALAGLRARVTAGETAPPRLADAGKLERGSTGPAVAALRARLRIEDPALPEGPDPARFDDALRDAVIAFQKRNRLDPDGVIGPATRAALNITPADRIRRIVVNMERWRWLPDELGPRYVMVNIADFSLDAVADGLVRQHMKVVVGRTYRRTPVFSAPMTYLEVNPYWHVPPTIAIKDLLPKMRQSVEFLASDGFRVFDGWGANAAEIDPQAVDWRTVSPKRFRYKLRQDPGAKNALGQIKFMFPNRYDVYLHDTPARNLFNRTVRLFSAGCIRVERPRDLALFELDGQPEWTPEALEDSFKAGQTRKIVLRRPLPVHVTYQTAWVEADGTAIFRADVYERDSELGKILFPR